MFVSVYSNFPPLERKGCFMDSDPRAFSDMFTTPAIQNPLVAQSYLMDSDSNANGRPKGTC